MLHKIAPPSNVKPSDYYDPENYAYWLLSKYDKTSLATQAMDILRANQDIEPIGQHLGEAVAAEDMLAKDLAVFIARNRDPASDLLYVDICREWAAEENDPDCP